MLLLLVNTNLKATVYYVATTGTDANNGTSISTPFLTISKAASKVVAGDVIYVRGGTYNITTKIALSKSGTATNRISLIAYPGDSRPKIDGSAMAAVSGNRGIELSGTYWYIKGIDVYKAGDNGMHISGAYNIVEQCNFYENRDTGCQLANGAAFNQIINCDSYYNRDSTSPANKDGNADGFAAKLDVGTGNSFKGCRAWQNSDDGWDGLLSTGLGTNPATTYDSCWCFMNGYYKSGSASIGNGNGFKMGGNNEQHDATLTRCLSAFNRVKGFDQNNNNGSMILYNCTGYKNKPNFGMNNNNPDPGKVMVVTNCVSLSSGSTDVFRTVCTRNNNSWQSGVTTTTADFVAIDSIGLRSPRKANGGLPDINFMHLVQGSDLIDAGTNVGLPFNGSNPDIGCFETNYPVPVKFSDYVLKYLPATKNNVAQVVNVWTTVTEINTSHFSIERSLNGKDFEPCGVVVAKGSGSYFFIDNNTHSIAESTTLYYRIVAFDNSGTKQYSEVRTAVITTTPKTLISIFPIPASNAATVSFALNKTTLVSAKLYNYAGKCVAQFFEQSFNEGLQQKTISLSNLPNGSYKLVVGFGLEKRETLPLIKM